MRRSRTALVLILCTLSACLLAVGFADGQNRPIDCSATARCQDLDQLYDDLSPTPWCDFDGEICQHATPVATLEAARPELCERLLLLVRSWPFDSVAAAADAIARALAKRAMPQCGGPLMSEESPCNEIAADESQPRDSDVTAWPVPWATFDAAAFDATERCVATDDSATISLFEALSIVWGVVDDAEAAQFAEDSADCISNDCTWLTFDPRPNMGNEIAEALNRQSQGQPYAPAIDDDSALEIVGLWISPWPLPVWQPTPDALASPAAAAPAEVAADMGYECFWSGCDAFPDASTAGLINDASQAGNISACRSLGGILAQAAGTIAHGSQAAMTAASHQLLNWLILNRFERSVPKLSAPTLLSPPPCHDAYRGTRGCFVL